MTLISYQHDVLILLNLTISTQLTTNFKLKLITDHWHWHLFFFQFLKNIILLLLQKLLHKISLSCYHLSINLNSSALLQILLSFNFTRFHGTCLDRSKTVSRSKIIWFEKISNQKAFIYIHYVAILWVTTNTSYVPPTFSIYDFILYPANII